MLIIVLTIHEGNIKNHKAESVIINIADSSYVLLIYGSFEVN